MVDLSHPSGGRVRWAGGHWLALSQYQAATGLRSTEFSSRQIGALFLILTAVTCIPIVLHPWPPLTDYMNHLSRMHIIATIGSDSDLARFYEINWQVIPNLMMDLVVPAIARIGNVHVAGQVYTVACFALTISGTLALNRQLFGRWSVLPLVACPLVYNNVLLVGTMNYVFGIGLALWALVAWVWLRERAMPVRLAVSTLFVLALFFCHLGLLAFELQRLREYRASRLLSADPHWHFSGLLSRAADFVATGLPFLVVLPLLLMSPTWNLRGSYLWELEGKLDGILYVVEVYSHLIAVLMTGIVAFAVGWAIRHGALRLHGFGLLLLGVGGVAYLALPRMIFDTYMADQRLPISLVFMAIAGVQLNVRNAHVRRGFAMVLVLLLALRMFEVQTVWNEASSTAGAFRNSVQLIERGAKVLVTYADPDAGEDHRDLGLVHAACLAIIERSALVTTAFTVTGKQILRVREEYRARVDSEDGTPPALSDLIAVSNSAESGAGYFWGGWMSDYDYVYVLFTESDHENPDAMRLSTVYVGDRFALYRIVPHSVNAGAPAALGGGDAALSANAPVGDSAPQIAKIRAPHTAESQTSR
jgi:hypothetical protein